MLTRDLLRFDRRKERLTPRFVDAGSQLLQNLVRDLAAVYVTGEGQTREELAEAVLPLIHASRSQQIAKGLNKLLLERCTFQESLEELAAERLLTFQAAARHLRSEAQNDLTAYRLAVARDRGSEDPDRLAEGLHADLPVRQPLLSFDPIEPEPLLDRYNLALAQGPLYWSDRLTLEIWEPDTGRRRQFFRYLKWFQLLARISPVPEITNGFVLELDGPLSLFDVPRKYGLKLAGFLPAVCALYRWKLRARVRLGDLPPATLELDDTLGLKSHFAHDATYIPDEFATFEAKFRQEVADWEIQPHTPLLDLGAQEMAVPDFSFRERSGARVVHLELLHRWHGAHLARRLARLDAMESPPCLAIGIDRALLKQPANESVLQSSAWFQAHGFPFNQFPPVKRVVAALESFCRSP
ncbi:MAG: DUF790 family protein [Magnetococcales bacterium]|nr:DUF790 family protein [Magnetococcales bacterium]